MRNTIMFYFDRPKLGSYIVLHCSYFYCDFEKAFINGFDDRLECSKKRNELEEISHAAADFSTLSRIATLYEMH